VDPLRRSAAIATAVAGAPVVGALWLARPRWRTGLRERLGAVPRAAGEGGVWVHGASVGEATAALPLLDRLRAGGRTVRASTTTATGRALLRRARPDLVSHLAPLDHPLAVEAALGRARPAALVLVETELWPAWIAGAGRRGVPVVTVSGRISDRSLPRYRRLGALWRRTFARLTAVGARTDEDAGRFVSLGVPAARVTVTGDLKAEPPPPRKVAPDLEALLGAMPVLLAGSTHEGEEAMALDAFEAALAEGLDAALVLAPRHPERFDAVARLAARRRAVRRRSGSGPGPLRSGEVLLLDTLGELPALASRARLAFVGGSWVRGVGGHNVLEPVFGGRPVVYGPQTGAWCEAVATLEACGAGRRVEDAAALARAWAQALRDPADAARRGGAGRAALAPHAGAAERAARLVESVLAGNVP